METIITRALSANRSAARKAYILDILLGNRGVVEFTNIRNGIRKYVDTWDPDDDGDLRAFKVVGGVTPHVCWSSPQYKVKEVTREEIEP